MASIVTFRGHIETAHIRQAIRGLKRGERQIPRDTALTIQRTARYFAPKRTGHLAKSIKASRRGVNDWEVEVGAHYGVYVEYGTRHMAAQPFFRPAVEAGVKQMRRGVKTMVR